MISNAKLKKTCLSFHHELCDSPLKLRCSSEIEVMSLFMVYSHCPTPRPIELCAGVHTAQRQTLTQITIGLCINLSVSVFILVCVSVSMSGNVDAPFSLYEELVSVILMKGVDFWSRT